MTINKQELEPWIDKLLIFMNDQVEDTGVKLKSVRFNFNENREDSTLFIQKFEIAYDDFLKIVKPCIARNFIEAKTAVGFGLITLTEEGQGRAISVVNAKHNPPVHPTNNSFHIENINAPSQIGNNNTQNIENLFLNLIDQIENTNATPEEKTEVKNRLRRFLEHPVTQSVLNTAPAILEKVL